MTHPIKPISYVKANASKVLEEVEFEPLIVTQNGEAKAVIQGIDDYNKTQDTLALLKILAMSQEDVRAGRVSPMEDVFDRIRNTSLNS